MTQTFSVSSDELGNFKERLAQLIESFADEAENPRGDSVAEICIAFTNNTIADEITKTFQHPQRHFAFGVGSLSDGAGPPRAELRRKLGQQERTLVLDAWRLQHDEDRP